MRIQLNHVIRTTDGASGEIADVVIDPITRSVTHLVVQPHHRHAQARLVPFDLVTVDGDNVLVDLDSDHLRALHSVADVDFVRKGELIDIDGDWDIGIQHVAALPHSTTGGLDACDSTDHVSVLYDRVPKGEIEIRRESAVVSADGHTVAVVDGFIADRTHLSLVVAVTGWVGFRHRVVVPVSAVTEFGNDHITVGLSKRQFDRLEPVSKLEGLDDPS